MQDTNIVSSDSSLVNNCSAFVMPGKIYRAILRNKLNIIDAVNYRRMRDIMSVDDLAELWHMNSNPLKSTDSQTKVDLSDWGSLELFSIINSLSEEDSIEIRRTIRPLSESIGISQAVMQRLSDTDTQTGIAYYKFISNNGIVFVVLEDGFLHCMHDHAYALCFYRDILKEFYKVAKISTVSQHHIYRGYVEALYKPVSKE